MLNGVLLHKSLWWLFFTGFLVVFPFFKEIVLDAQWNNLKSKDMWTDLASYFIGFSGITIYFLR